MTIQDVGQDAPWGRFPGLPLPVQPNGRAERLARGLERLVELREEMIAKLINELDAAEGDAADREPEEDDDTEAEPSLGWTASNQLGSVHDGELDESDNEPSLGWNASGSLGGTSDREHEDEREPEHEGYNLADCMTERERDDSDYEATCGWPLPGGVLANSGRAVDPATVFGEAEGNGMPSGAGHSSHVRAVAERLGSLAPRYGSNVISFRGGVLTLIGPGVGLVTG